MDAADVCVVSSRDGRGGLVVRIGIPLVDVYLEFLGGRCRPDTVLAAAYDLKVFFEVVARPADQVQPADVLGFITAQRAGCGGSRALQAVGVPGEHGVSAATVRRRLSIVSGFFAFLWARGDVVANPVPRGLPTRRERSRTGQGVPLVRAARRPPRILSPAEVDALTAALRTHRDRARRRVRGRGTAGTPRCRRRQMTCRAARRRGSSGGLLSGRRRRSGGSSRAARGRP
jgi:integrase/recombinase XerD